MVKKINESNEKACSLLSYLIIGIIWFFIDKDIRKSEKVKFHVKQSIILFITNLIIWAISGVPFMGEFVAKILFLGIIILLIIGIINVLNDKKKELPILGGFAKKLSF